MVGSIEHAIAEDRLDEDGDLWRPSEPDPTASRECSTPFHVSPYRGKYTVQDTTPDGLKLQKLMAGAAGSEGLHAVWRLHCVFGRLREALPLLWNCIPKPMRQRHCLTATGTFLQAAYTVHGRTRSPGMRDRGAKAAVVECTSVALAQGRCTWLDVDVAVFTSLGGRNNKHTYSV